MERGTYKPWSVPHTTDSNPGRNGNGISDVYWICQKGVPANNELESMMKRTLFFFVTALFALTCLGLAGQFWEDKAYQDWTDKDVEKLLKKSPWSQKSLWPWAAAALETAVAAACQQPPAEARAAACRVPVRRARK